MNVFINRENIWHLYADFKSGKSNKLLVLGYSGSGKTTFAKKLAAKFGATYISLDDFFFSNRDLKRNNLARYNLQRKKFEEKILFSETEEKQVIEGIGALNHSNNPQLLKIPSVILGTSLITSSLRGSLRNIRESKNSRFKEFFVPWEKNIKKYHAKLVEYEKLVRNCNERRVRLSEH